DVTGLKKYYRDDGTYDGPTFVHSQNFIPSVRKARKAGVLAPLGFAKGGSTKVTSRMTEDALADLQALRPYVGYRGRRAAKNNDRAAAADVPYGVARGVLASIPGFVGDMEGLGRTLY